MIYFNDIIDKTKYLIAISKEAKGNPSPDKSGGFLTFGLKDFEQNYMGFIGEVPMEKQLKYSRLSQEKAYRIYSDWLRNIDDLKEVFSSYQTRNPDLNMWGGAVLFEHKYVAPNIISFSGLSEVADEALSFILGHSFGFTKGNEELFEKVKKTSDNPVIENMFDRFNKEYKLVA